MSVQPAPLRLRNISRQFSILRGGLWMTADERFCVTRLRDRGHWVLTAWHQSPTYQADEALLIRCRLDSSHCAFPSRREAVAALALALEEAA